MRSAICFLPVVGTFIGTALIIWQWFCLTFEVGAALFAAVAAVLPLLFTGGIHMDGFMDTADALSSHQPRERKLEIMKDSHTGAFGVIWCASYLLLSFGLYWFFIRKRLRRSASALFSPRALCALSALTLPGARSGGMLFAFTEHAKNRFAVAGLCALSLLCAGGLMLLDLWPGLWGAALGHSLFGYRRMAKKQLGV
jgi:adenosylcobinamide-GDP ribazoletransferase